VLVLAPAAQSVVLLGDVRQLEVQAEGAEHLPLALEFELRDGVPQFLPPRGAALRARLARQPPDPLLLVEQLLPLLLDEYPAEDVAQQADVAAERRVGYRCSLAG
jgi:hypothetical protein